MNNIMEKIYVGITDTEWLYHLKGKKDLGELGDEINFWTPGATNFKAINTGEIFLFKMHSRKSKGENGEIVGGGIFKEYTEMTELEAWNRFGTGNGTEDYSQMSSAINSYRSRNNTKNNGYIGCIVLTDVFFIPKSRWIKSPADWNRNIVRGKTYNCTEEIGRELKESVLPYIGLKSDMTEKLVLEIDSEISENLKGEERKSLIRVRVNQSVFRKKLLERYDSCNLCNVKNKDFLIASHIKPWADSNPTEKLDINNGFLLCPNHDALFDKGYISFDDTGKIIISTELKKQDRIFLNVNEDMFIPANANNVKYLKYHREHVFRKQ